MFRTGVITDGISRDLEYALDVMVQSGLEYVELQYLWDKQVGDLTPDDVARVKELIAERNLKVSCISHHNLSGIPLTAEDEYRQQLTVLRRCMGIAREMGTHLVRIFTFRKEMVLFGSEPIVAPSAWAQLLRRLEEPLRMAEGEEITLAVETAIGSNVTSAALARRLIDELGSDRLRVLWDPCSSLYCTEVPFPDGYEAIRDYVVHIHLKDGIVDLPMASFEFCPLGEGQMRAHYADIVRALRQDGYEGTISLESVYAPANGTREDGFRVSLPVFKDILS